MSNIIEFIAEDRYSYEVCPRPFPAVQALPQWWKDAMPYVKGPKNLDGKKIVINNGETNASFKKCTALRDVYSSGYVVPLMCDVLISIENNIPKIDWRIQKNVFEFHNGQEVETPDGYYQHQFKYLNPWIPKLPSGFSALIIPCPAYPNTPFKAMSGVIDYDKTPHSLWPPVYLKKGFEGIVEKGTPMFQIVPFKRNNWKSKFSFYQDGEMAIKLDRDVKSTIVNNYIKNVWQKKEYQ